MSDMNAVETKRVIQKCKEALAKAYGKRLKGVILYGSVARRAVFLFSCPLCYTDLIVNRVG
jgi:hypothetical protein